MLSEHWFPPHTPSLAGYIYIIENVAQRTSSLVSYTKDNFFQLGILFC